MEVLDQNNQNNQVQFFMFAFQRLRSDGGSVYSVFCFFYFQRNFIFLSE